MEKAFKVTYRKGLDTLIGTLVITDNEFSFSKGGNALDHAVNALSFYRNASWSYKISDVAEVKNGMLALFSVKLKDGTKVKLSADRADKAEIISLLSPRH